MSLHLIPTDDHQVEHHTTEDCACRPRVTAGPRDDGSYGRLVVHHAERRPSTNQRARPTGDRR